LKNEVKKKMMIDPRKLPHQSHHERSSETKVNKNFEERVGSRAIFSLRARIAIGIHVTVGDTNLPASFPARRHT
jgi:hypothetical protein